MKTTMVVLVTVLTLILSAISMASGGEGVSFPFRPSNLSALNLFVIGIASFVLALKPNKNLIKGKFLLNTFKSTLPSGIAMFMSVALVYAFSGVLKLNTQDQLTTVAMFAMSYTGVAALWLLCFPFDWYNIAVAAFGTVGVTGTLLLFQPLYTWV